MLASITVIFLTACFPEFGLAIFVPLNSSTLTEKIESNVSFSWLYQGDKNQLQRADIRVIHDGQTELKYRFNFLGADSPFGPAEYFKRVSITKTLSSNQLKIDVVIQNASEQDTALYRCSVSLISSATIISQDIQLIVTVPPQISVNNKKITAKEGDRVVIQCSATGTPVPNVTWSNNRQGELRYGKGNASLFFKNITRNEQGTYVCIAKNSGGKKEKESIVNVVYLDFNCSLEFEGKIAYRLVYIKGNPSPSESSCKKGKTKLALNVSKPYICLANNTFFYHTCIVSSKHENVTINCSNNTPVRIVNTTLSYYSITSNGVSRIRVPPTSDNGGQFENYSQARKSLEKRVCKQEPKSPSPSKDVPLIVGATLGGAGGLLVVVAAGVYTYKKKYAEHNTIN